MSSPDQKRRYLEIRLCRNFLLCSFTMCSKLTVRERGRGEGVQQNGNIFCLKNMASSIVFLVSFCWRGGRRNDILELTSFLNDPYPKFWEHFLSSQCSFVNEIRREIRYVSISLHLNILTLPFWEGIFIASYNLYRLGIKDKTDQPEIQE